MSATVLYMSMSLDGFIADPDEDPGRLHDWVFPGAENGDFEAAVARLRGVNRQIYDEFMSTGAVLAGRGTFEPAGGWAGTTTTAYRSTSSAGTPHPTGRPTGPTCTT